MMVLVIVALAIVFAAELALAGVLWVAIHQHNELVRDYVTTREAVTACAKVIRAVAQGPADA